MASGLKIAQRTEVASALKMTNDISVIICAYSEDRWSTLVAAVASVQRQTLPPREIIIVIDHNPDLLKRVQGHLTSVIIIENTEPRGLSGARNCGIAIAKSELVAFLDDDAAATPDWLLLLSKGFSEPGAIGVGGAIIPRWESIHPAWLPEEFYWVVGCTYKGMPLTIQTIRNPIGANMCFRRDIFAVMGGFRSGIGRVGTLPMGCEETELCIRVRQHWPDGEFYYLPQASVSHAVSASRTSWKYFRTRCYAEGLSKALVTQNVGVRDALASERSYTLRTLPHGIIHNLARGLWQHDGTKLARAVAIIAGLTITTAGYMMGRASASIAKANKVLLIGLPRRDADISTPIKAQSKI